MRKPKSEWRDCGFASKSFRENAPGEITNEQFSMLASGCEAEKSELSKRDEELRNELEAVDKKGSDVRKFVPPVRKHTEINELNYEILHEFIDRILIHEANRKTKTREIEIYYSFAVKLEM